MVNSGNNNAFDSLIGHSAILESVIRTAQIIAATDVPVLIEGDTGTGKELLARAIQKSSKRSDRPFIILNCAALPAELVESLLFGHEKGAFTGAHEKKEGYVQKAAGGTLFLDEIGELPVELQAKLLRFIEHGECQRLGAHQNEIIDVRILAATNHDLLQQIKLGNFRQDLFYRLSVVTLRLPSLIERRNDIPELARHLLQQAAERNNQKPCVFSKDAVNQLKHNAWPGNIRELKNVCEHVTALFPGETIDKDRLPITVQHSSPSGDSGYTLPKYGVDMEQLEIDLIKQALEHSGGNKSRAARLLGLSRDAFLYRLKKHGL